MNPALVTVIAVAALIGLLVVVTRRVNRASFGFRTIYEWQYGLVYRNGRFAGQVGPGTYWTDPFKTILAVTSAEQILLVPAQEVLSADGFQVKLGAVVRYRIANPRVAQEKHENGPAQALHVAVQLGLRAIAAARSLDELLSARKELDSELAAAVKPGEEPLGIEVVEIRLRDLILPAEVRRMMTEVERARREGLAALERARGEQAALRALANAARLLKNNPELQNLRVLQALAGATGKTAPTLVLGTGNSLFVPQRPDASTAAPAAGEVESPASE